MLDTRGSWSHVPLLLVAMTSMRSSMGMSAGEREEREMCMPTLRRPMLIRAEFPCHSHPRRFSTRQSVSCWTSKKNVFSAKDTPSFHPPVGILPARSPCKWSRWPGCDVTLHLFRPKTAMLASEGSAPNRDKFSSPIQMPKCKLSDILQKAFAV